MLRHLYLMSKVKLQLSYFWSESISVRYFGMNEDSYCCTKVFWEVITFRLHIRLLIDVNQEIE